MRLLFGPVLHLRHAPATIWRFAVGVHVAAPDLGAVTLTFAPGSGAEVGPATRIGDFHEGSWISWDVAVPRRAAEVRTSYRITGIGKMPIEFDDVVIPALDQAPRLAFFSCNGVQYDEDWTNQPEMERLWASMRERHRSDPAPDGAGGPYHVLIGGGDQIYCDAVWSTQRLKRFDTWRKRTKATLTPALTREIEELYGSLYRERWGRSAFRELHARIPGVYTWDDHDIFDGWGSYEDEIQNSPLLQEIFTIARRAFILFQLGGMRAGGLCVDPGGDHFLQVVRFERQLDIVMLDLRSRRTMTEVLGQSQWTALTRYLAHRREDADAPPHMLVVSSIPLVYLNFASAESVLKWLPFRQELEDDLRDQWESHAHQQERARLIMTLLDHGKEARSRITVLSGDVHVGARGQIVSQRPEHVLPEEPEAVMHQLTSSAIVYPPPKPLQLIGMRAIAAEGRTPLLAVSHVATELVAVGAGCMLLGANNWLSIEPDLRWSSSRRRLWTRWITDKGSIEPPLMVTRRSTAD